MNAIDYFDRGWRLDPQAPCLVDGLSGQSLSYEEVHGFTNTVADALRLHGIGIGSHVAVLSYNSPMGFTAVLSVLRAGAVWLPLNPRNSAADNAKTLSRLNCQVLFYERAFADTVSQMLQQADGIGLCVCIDGRHDTASGPSACLPDWLARSPQAAATALPPDPERTFAIQSTGGTTGLPKGVVMPNRVLDFIVRTFLSVAPFEGRPVFLAAAPLTHAAGMVLQHLFTQAGTAILFAKVDKAALLDAIPRHRVTHTFLPPTVIYELLAQPGVRERDYSSLRYLFYGASPMAPDKLREAIEVFGPVLAQIYGQTEAGVPLTFLSPADHLVDGRPAPRERLASAGRVTPYARVAIAAEDGSLLPAGEAGEIVVQGDGLMSGYYADAEATAAVLRDGWLRTGDIGRFDDDGLLHIVDRSRDLIISGGFNVYSAEVERAVMAHPGVQDCAVIGLPDPKWGESVLAIVVRRPGASVTPEELIAHCKALVGSMKSPKRVDFADELPRSPVGKVLKRELKQRYWGERDRLVS